MARAFRRAGGSYVAELEADEARLVITLARDVLQLLSARAEATRGPADEAPHSGGETPDVGQQDGTGPRWWEELGLTDPEARPQAPTSLDPPRDPALARLLPATSTDDPEEAARLRAMLEPQVLDTKRQALQEAIDLLGRDPLRVPEDMAPRFGSALNDIRLVLAQRLGIEDEADAVRVNHLAETERDVDDVEHFMAMLYAFVSWLQESLMTALLKRR